MIFWLIVCSCYHLNNNYFLNRLTLEIGHKLSIWKEKEWEMWVFNNWIFFKSKMSLKNNLYRVVWAHGDEKISVENQNIEPDFQWTRRSTDVGHKTRSPLDLTHGRWPILLSRVLSRQINVLRWGNHFDVFFADVCNMHWNVIVFWTVWIETCSSRFFRCCRRWWRIVGSIV